MSGYEKKGSLSALKFRKKKAPLLSAVSASGGVGKSTLVLIMAYLCAQSGLSTVLLEGDLQFGDYSFWLGLDDELSNLGEDNFEPIKIADKLNLYRAPLFPELAEDKYEAITSRLDEMRTQCDVMFADTGAFWTGFTADLLLVSDLFFVVMDPRTSSINGSIKAMELCARLNVPLMRMVGVYNRFYSRAPINLAEAKRGLDSEEVFCIPDGRGNIESMIGSGNIDILLDSEEIVVDEIDKMLTSIMPRTGLEYSSHKNKRKARKWHV